MCSAFPPGSYVPRPTVEDPGQLRVESQAPILSREVGCNDLAHAGVLVDDPYLVFVDLDDVVRGPRVTAHSVTGSGTGVDEKHVAQLPHVRNVFVAAKHEVYAQLREQRQDISRIPHDISLTTGARHRNQVMVEYEDSVVVLPCERLPDPVVLAVSDLAF